MVGSLAFDVGDLCIRIEIKATDIQRKQLEVIVVLTVAFGRARSAVAPLAEVI